jgi:hypothetical protein
VRLQVTLVKLLAVLALVSTVVVSGAAGAAAQVMVSPDAEPVRNDGGWIYWLAVALMVVGLIAAVAVAFAYMRRAPRFQRDESARKTVKAERIQPGAEVPRRPVNVSGAPAIVPPPTRVLAAVAAPAAVAASTPAPAPAPATAPAAASPAPAPVAQEPVEPAAAASAPAPVPTAEQATAAPAAAAEHKEVALDQETFDRVLAELLEKGTTRRVAEGQARRAAMIAARKKAGG